MSGREEETYADEPLPEKRAVIQTAFVHCTVDLTKQKSCTPCTTSNNLLKSLYHFAWKIKISHTTVLGSVFMTKRRRRKPDPP